MIAADTPWRQASRDRRGSGSLIFGRMFEDWTIEASLFPPGARVFSIASAGCTALSLAALGHNVTAVDINAAQVDLVRHRIAGGQSRAGVVDRMMARGRRAQRLLGWTDATLREFLSLEDPAEQRAFWRERLDTRRWRAVLAVLLSPAVLRLSYPGVLVRALPRGFSTIVRLRLDRGFSTHPNRTNEYARRLLLGEWPTKPLPASPGSITAVHADAAAYLEACPPQSFTAFTLSNILDGVGATYASRLGAAVDRAAAPGAVIVLRSFSQPATPDEDAWARRDRAILWGSIRVDRR